MAEYGKHSEFAARCEARDQKELIACSKCGHQFKGKHENECQICNPTELKKVLAEAKQRSTKEGLIAGLIFSIVIPFIFMGCQQLLKQTPEEVATERCFLEATLAAKAGGNKSFRYANEISPTRAELVFSRNGATWSTYYFCES